MNTPDIRTALQSPRKRTVHLPILHCREDCFCGTGQHCQCGHLIRSIAAGEDWLAGNYTCPSCGGGVECGEVRRIDRFSGLEAIFADHAIQRVPGYGFGSRFLPHPPNFPPAQIEDFDHTYDDE